MPRQNEGEHHPQTVAHHDGRPADRSCLKGRHGCIFTASHRVTRTIFWKVKCTFEAIQRVEACQLRTIPANVTTLLKTLFGCLQLLPVRRKFPSRFAWTWTEPSSSPTSCGN